MSFVEWLGVAGSTIILIDYALLVHGTLPVTGLTYNLINIVGAVLLGINVGAHDAWPAVWLQATFAVIAVFAIVKNLRGIA